jgi:hypothetical protein
MGARRGHVGQGERRLGHVVIDRRARLQGLLTLRAVARLLHQRVRRRQCLLHLGRHAHHVHRAPSAVEGRGRRTGALVRGRGALQQRQLLRPARPPQCLGGALLKGRRGARPVLAGRPVPGHARGRRAGHLQPVRDAPVQRARQHQRHAGRDGLAHQVVREGLAGEHVGILQLAPRRHQRRHAALDHRRGELGAEVLLRHRRHLRQLQGRGRQPAQPLAQHGIERVRRRQALRRLAVALRTQSVELAERGQHQQGDAPGVRHQARRPGGRVELRQVQGGEQRLQSLHVEGLQAQHHQARAGRLVEPLLQRGRHLARPHRHQPAQPGGRRAGQRQQQLERGGVGEVQVIQHKAGQAGGAPRGERLLERDAQRRRLGRADTRGPERGCEPGQQRARRGADRRVAEARVQRFQQPYRQRIGRPLVAGPARARHVRLGRGGALDRLLQQPALADARLGDHQHRAPVALGASERLPGLLAADQLRRATQRLRHRTRHRRRGIDAVRDGGHQLARLRARRLAELAPQHLGAGLVRGERRGAVAAQVVQAHQAPVGVLLQRILLDDALRVGQRRRDLLARLALARQLRQPLQPRAAPARPRRAGPALERLAVAVVVGAEQRPLRRAGVVGQALVGLRQVDLDALGQPQHALRQHHISPRRAAQAEQALAQVGARLPVADVGPQQAAGRGVLLRPFLRQQRQQRGVLALQQVHHPVAALQARRAEQKDAQAVGPAGPVRGDRGGRFRRGRHGRPPGADFVLLADACRLRPTRAGRAPRSSQPSGAGRRRSMPTLSMRA